MPGCWRARGAAAAVLGSALLGAACSGAKTATPATHAASKGGLRTGLERRALAAEYLVIAQAGNRRLEVDFDGLKGRDRNRLTSGEANLRDAAATKRLFDRRLLRIVFPPETERVARVLYSVNQARARLTVAAAGSTSLRELRLFEPALAAANGPRGAGGQNDPAPARSAATVDKLKGAEKGHRTHRPAVHSPPEIRDDGEGFRGRDRHC